MGMAEISVDETTNLGLVVNREPGVHCTTGGLLILALTPPVGDVHIPAVIMPAQ